MARLDEMVTSGGHVEPEKIKEPTCQSESAASAQSSSSSSPSLASDVSSSVIEDQGLYDLITQLVQGNVGHVEIPLPDGSVLQLDVDGANVTWAMDIDCTSNSDHVVTQVEGREIEGSTDDESTESKRSDDVSNDDDFAAVESQGPSIDDNENANMDRTSDDITVLTQESPQDTPAIQQCCGMTQVPQQEAWLEANLNRMDKADSTAELVCQKRALANTVPIGQLYHSGHACQGCVKVSPSLTPNWRAPSLFPWAMVSPSGCHVDEDWQCRFAVKASSSPAEMTAQDGFPLPVTLCPLCGAMQRLQIFDCQSYPMAKMASWPYPSNDVISKDLRHSIVQKSSSRHGQRTLNGGRHRLNPKVIGRLRDLHFKPEPGLNDSLG